MTLRLEVLVACLWLSAVAGVRPQDPSLFADMRLYDAMLQRLFQHEAQPDSEIQLRYTHSDASEMQILIRRLHADFRLEVSYVPTGSPTLWDQLAKAATLQPRLTPEDAARLMKFERKILVATHGTALWKQLDAAESVAIPVVNRDLFPLESMKYEFALRSDMEQMTLTMWSNQEAGKSEYELIRWMGKVRASVESLLKGS